MGRFHGVTTVAELKHRPDAPGLVGVGRFHGVTTVAELKLSGENLTLGTGSFHGVTTVAELKPRRPSRDASFPLVSTASQPWPN